jgi:hypothetical protein
VLNTWIGYILDITSWKTGKGPVEIFMTLRKGFHGRGKFPRFEKENTSPQE